MKNAGYLLEELRLQRLKAKDHTPHAVQALQRDLRLPKEPRRIECFDISNIQGADPVASMVCFIDGKAKKSEYRKFNIQVKSTPDDFAMMREAVERRYSRLVREEKDLPDLIIVDGGKGQLSSAVSILKKLGLKDQLIIGLAKRLEEVFLPTIKLRSNSLQRSSVNATHIKPRASMGNTIFIRHWENIYTIPFQILLNEQAEFPVLPCKGKHQLLFQYLESFCRDGLHSREE